MEDQASETCKALVERLRRASSVCALTGAGVSKESGVPTFREADGLWNRFRPEELANVEAFIRNPTLVWEWYSWRRELMSRVQPNAGHYALAELSSLLKSFTLITQNVDNLHRQAGSKDVIELHGNIQRNKCQECKTVYLPDDSRTRFEFRKGQLPHCPECNTGLLRPDVVWFGEMLPEDAITQSWEAAERCDLFLSIGTSAVVYPAAALPQVAQASGAFLVEINPQVTELSGKADLSFREPSGEILPTLVNLLKEQA